MGTQKAFSENLRRIRENRGMRQADLAEKCEMGVQTISNYETGIRWPQPDVIDLLAKTLKVRPWQLLAEEGEGGTIPPELVDHVAAAARACGLKVNAGRP